ncbi:DUF4224 domain-containing protein [Stenotrophomonas sp. TWI1151]|uniref:DUF4224 domain-containing protein n=1 Tax=Stenotrophomonas sp. TWI1151 TaxID=3136798 RepID=UPI0032082BAC
MAVNICLSREEVRQLCRTPQKARQVTFLQRNGIRHYLDAHGWPVVIRASLEQTERATPAGAGSWKSNKAA